MSEEQDRSPLPARTRADADTRSLAADSPAPEEPAAQRGARRLWRRIAVVATTGLVTGSVYVGVRGAAPDSVPGGPPTATTATPSDGAEAAVGRSAAGGALLRRLAEAIDHGDRAGMAAVLDPEAPEVGSQARRMYDNLRALPLASLAMRYVGDDPTPLPANRRQQLGGSAVWVAQVEVSWRLRDFDRQPVRITVPMTMVTRRDSTYLSSLTDLVAPGQRRPIWLLGDLRVRHGTRSLVVSTDPAADLGAYAQLIDRAIADVARVWGSATWSRRVVLYLPGTQSQLEYVLGAKPHTYAQIAAVTTGEAAQRLGGAPVRIVANPTLFGKLGANGRRIVLTHETTHVASEATVSGAPLWLAEGFADYVAFRAVDVATAAAANELFTAVRAGQGPKALPEPAAFAASSRRLAVAYESSWLACQLIATRYGQPKLVAFYRAAHWSNSPAGLRDAFSTVLGTTQDEFVADWIRYLDRLAHD